MLQQVTEFYDELLYEPWNMKIVSVLAHCASTDDTFLAQITGLSRSMLRHHLYRLQEQGLLYIDTEELAPGKIHISLSAQGRRCIATLQEEPTHARKQIRIDITLTIHLQ